MPNWPILLRSSIARVAALYALFLSISMLALMAGTYLGTARLLDSEANELINVDVQSLLEAYSENNFETFKTEFTEHTENPGLQGAVYELRNTSGAFIAGNVAILPDLKPDRRGWVEFEVTLSREDTEQSRRIRGRIVYLPDGHQLLVGHDVEDRDTFRNLMLKTMAGTVAFTLLFGALGGWWLGRRVTQTNRAISQSSVRLLEGNLTERLPTTGHNDEFDALVSRFNELISTIENLTLTLRSVLDSTAHDLRGHLHRIQQSVEHLKAQLSHSAHATAADVVLVEIDRLNTTVEDLLRIALAESGTVSLEPIDLSTLVTDICEFYEPVAQQRLRLQVAKGVTIRGHRPLLNQALSNILDNAIKYSPDAIDVNLKSKSGGIELEVCDRGKGIPQEWAHLATQRFKRLPSSSGLPGSGLGLSLVAAVARLHKGELSLINRYPGLCVKIRFNT